jgi:hypothetical protein
MHTCVCQHPGVVGGSLWHLNRRVAAAVVEAVPCKAVGALCVWAQQQQQQQQQQRRWESGSVNAAGSSV